VIAPSSPSSIINLFFPVFQKTKFRWVLDCKVLNSIVSKHGVRYESVAQVKSFLQKGDFITSIDVKGAFFHIPIAPNSRYWLQFIADGTIYHFQTLPFGVTTAPYIWTKVLAQIINHLRRRGIRLSVYMDDILIAAFSHEESLLHTKTVEECLLSAGITINYEKCALNPSHSLSHIGFIWNTQKNLLLLSLEKIRDISRSARKLLSMTTISCRALASTIGKLTACSPAFLPAIYKRRSLNQDLQQALKNSSHINWNNTAFLSRQSIADLKFFSSPTLMSKFNGRPLLSSDPDWVLTTDASPFGWGATLLDTRTNRSFFTKGQFSAAEQLLSSNWRETSALSLALLSFKDVILLDPGPIHFRTDNTTALSYLRRMGGSIPSLQAAIDPSIKFLIRHRISFTATHLPGILNAVADRLSRSRRRVHDYSLKRRYFIKLQKTARSPFSIDLFACRLSAQLPRFCSRLPDPKATYRDAFLIDWSREHAFVFPPIPLIPRVISYFLSLKSLCHITLVVPTWQSAIWWPTLLQLATEPPTAIPPSNIQRGTSPSSAFKNSHMPQMSYFHLSNIV